MTAEIGLALCAIVIFVIFIAMLGAREKTNQSRQSALQVANEAYQTALGELRQDPGNPTKRQTALALGREYSALSRQGGATIYDEMALNNDISAAAAAVGTAQAGPAVSSPADRLKRLDELKAQGLISDTEHQAQRSKILDSM